jgi:predicted SPOUT superfamily RNA methylase MTH1
LRELAIAIPSNILEDCQSLSDKTNKIGLIARAISIFKVTKIHVYKNKGRSDNEFILLLLRYLVTPQYLRKNLFPIKKELKLAGTLPPLRIPSHTVNRQYNPEIVDIRDGLCIKFDKKLKMSIIDIGLDKYGIINDNIPINKIITVKIISISHQGKYFQLQRIKPVNYWGYDVASNNSLKDVLTSNDYDIKIITSKFGNNFHSSSKLILDKLDEKSHSSILIAFGSPKTGLIPLLSREKIDKSNLILINLFPDQGVETIRSEEAILAGLSLFNSLFTR